MGADAKSSHPGSGHTPATTTMSYICILHVPSRKVLLKDDVEIRAHFSKHRRQRGRLRYPPRSTRGSPLQKRVRPPRLYGRPVVSGWPERARTVPALPACRPARSWWCTPAHSAAACAPSCCRPWPAAGPLPAARCGPVSPGSSPPAPAWRRGV